MNLRIIAGKFKGRTIDSPNVSAIHPMGERIRGAIFNGLYNLVDFWFHSYQ
jgi:16S rRNA G966 N2-methylase RsmD